MSGAANQGSYGNPGVGQSPWGPGSGWGAGWGNSAGNSGGGNGWYGGPWPGGRVPWWAMSRPLLIAATITGFLIWWPVGLTLLFVAIWNKKLGFWACGRAGGYQNTQNGGGAPWSAPWSGWKSRCGGATQSSGNRAFDDYREQTLQRLEEEQREFGAFLDRLRFAKDKSEFDQFMNERRNQPPAPTTEPPAPDSRPG